MRVELDFKLCPENITQAGGVKLADATKTELHYYCFPGDVIFKSGKVDFSAMWGWVQIYDFAVCLTEIAGTITEDKAQEFEYTEADAVLRFILEGELVVITSNYAPGSIRLRHDELVTLSNNFLSRVKIEIFRFWPESYDNSILRQNDETFSE